MNPLENETLSSADAIMPHVATSAYLVDPKKIVLSGNIFNEISPEELENLHRIFKAYDIPMDMIITKGNHELDPAKGAALIAMNDYISTFIEKVGAR